MNITKDIDQKLRSNRFTQTVSGQRDWSRKMKTGDLGAQEAGFPRKLAL